MSRIERSPLMRASRNACTRLEIACISKAGARGTGRSGSRSHAGNSRVRGAVGAAPTGVRRTTAARRLRSRSVNTVSVEVKNATIGDGAKVPHLSYVGDADIGEGTNIGAGTIFANYDGIRKHRTTVGRHAKTGSNNTFVAPVVIGDGAVTGGGTVVREDVPPGALVVSSPPQRTIEGWVQRRRPGTPAAEAAAQASHEDPEGAPSPAPE